MLQPIAPPPGLALNGTAYSAKGRWRDGNLVRWVNGHLEPIGGWVSADLTAFSGKCRGMVAWRTSSVTRILALGTHTGLYASPDSSTLSDITPVAYTAGREDSIYGSGYGTADYGEGDYGTPRAIGTTLLDATTWSLDTFGDDLIACASHEGTIYRWQGNPAVDAAALAGAPTDCAGIVVTDERHIVALAAGGDPRHLEWCSREAPTDWTPSATNTAGSLDLKTQGHLQMGLRVRGQTLLLTSTDAHALNFIGSPDVYGTEKVGDGCGIVGKRAGCSLDSFAVWMGTRGFYLYDGSVKPLPCDINDYIFNDINRGQLAKVYAVYFSRFREVWFMYPSAGSTECDRIAIWSPSGGYWTKANIARTAGVDEAPFAQPMMAGTGGTTYEHENGFTDDGVARLDDCYATTAPIELGDGSRRMAARYLYPDEATLGSTTVAFSVKRAPLDSATAVGPYTLSYKTPVRFQGRQAEVTVAGAADERWKVGVLRLEVVPGDGR